MSSTLGSSASGSSSPETTDSKPLAELYPPETKILLVDDSQIQAKALAKIFQALGFQKIFLCHDPFMALPTIEKEAIEVIFCDWNMPDCSGLEIFAELKKDPAKAKLPFILLTANSAKEQVVQAIMSGVTDYLVKPPTKEILEKKLREISARR